MGRTRRHRSEVELRRRREKEATGAKETQALQQAAELRKAWQVRQRRKALAWVLMGLAPIIVVSHLLEHAGAFQLYSAGLEDLTVGYPTALLVFVTGAIVYGRD